MRVTRIQVGLLLLLLYAAVSDARWVYRAVRGVADAARDDPITTYERRFRELRHALPSRGVIGYTSGVQPEVFSSEDFRRFVLAEYSLAPLLVLNDTAPELVVGNFAPDSVPGRPPPGFQLVRDFGRGIWLLRRAQ
ncbi:MAG: hypothetical protein H0T86_04005 [Gemmatimonadales bacterium]|nr:hypothetical protein [Gemmatimonadales bacterium]